MSFFDKICYCFCNKAGTVPLEEEGENQLETGIRRKDYPEENRKPDGICHWAFVYEHYFFDLSFVAF